MALDTILKDSDSKAMLETVFRGQTPLSLAVSLSHNECVSILLKHGASTLKRNSQNWTPFQEATSIGDRAMMTMLIEYRHKHLTQWLKIEGKKWMSTLSAVLSVH